MDRLSSSIEQIAKQNYGDVSRLQLRYQQPRLCKIADGMIDPSVHDFGLRVWLQTKVGETSEYALAPRAFQSRETPFMTAQERARGTDFTVVGEPVDGDIRKAVYEVFDFTVDKNGMIDILKQGRAILGTISMYTGDGSVDSHGNAYLLVPEIINHPHYGNRAPTFYILETYKFHSDEVAKAFEYYFDDVFDPYNRLGQKVEVWRMNAIELQKFDPLCMSWSIMMLYYLAKMPIPQSEMVDNKYITVEKPLHLNVAVPSLINRAIAKLKADMGGEFLPATATATAFPHLYGTGKRKRGEPEDLGPDVLEIEKGTIFKHGSKLQFKDFLNLFKEGQFIWTYPFDAQTDHSGKKMWLKATNPLKVFNLRTHSGTVKFREALQLLPDDRLIKLFDEKISNFKEFLRGDDPSYKTVGVIDKELAAGLAKYQDLHKMDGWKLKLPANPDSEYLFLFPSEHFSIHAERDFPKSV
jgi:hypothetical protein